MSKSLRREFVMLAHDFDFSKHRMAGMYVSEKLDGMRCLWIPSTRGKSTNDVPFSNAKKEFVCSGLWSRYGHPIHCPDGWTDGWPQSCMLDGELWAGRGTMQQLMSAVKKHVAIPSEWEKVKFYVFDQPSEFQVFRPGTIKNANFSHTFPARGGSAGDSYPTFDHVYRRFKLHGLGTTPGAKNIELLEQTLTSFHTDAARSYIEERLAEVSAGGGEGLMIRYAAGKWEPIRSKEILKLKKLQRAQGVVSGFKAGLGKHQGRIGSVRVEWLDRGVSFDLAGFTDAERELLPAWAGWADVNAGERMPSDATGVCFKVGDIIPFVYRDLTEDGIPKEARYSAGINLVGGS